MPDDKQLEKDIEELKKQAEEYLNGWKRAKADLVNYQKQIEREKTDWFLFASAGCAKAALPVLDSLEMAATQESGIKNQESGVAKIRDQMVDILRKMSVEQIKTLGEPVNTEFHEAVGVEKSDEHASGVIVKEVQRGYIMNGKVLRPAKVIVSE